MPFGGFSPLELSNSQSSISKLLKMTKPLSYADSGVSLDAATEFS